MKRAARPSDHKGDGSFPPRRPCSSPQRHVRARPAACSRDRNAQLDATCRRLAEPRGQRQLRQGPPRLARPGSAPPDGRPLAARTRRPDRRKASPAARDLPRAEPRALDRGERPLRRRRLGSWPADAPARVPEGHGARAGSRGREENDLHPRRPTLGPRPGSLSRSARRRSARALALQAPRLLRGRTRIDPPASDQVSPKLPAAASASATTTSSSAAATATPAAHR